MAVYPLTSSKAEGEVVPIPTLPAVSIVKSDPASPYPIVNLPELPHPPTPATQRVVETVPAVS